MDGSHEASEGREDRTRLAYQTLLQLLHKYAAITHDMLRLDLTHESGVHELTDQQDRQAELSDRIQGLMNGQSQDMTEELRQLGKSCIELQQQLKTKLTSAKETLQGSLKVMNKTAAMTAAYHKSYTAANGFFIDQNK